MRNARSLGAEMNSRAARRDISDHLRDELRRDTARAVLQQILVLRAESSESADTRADVDADLLRVDLADDPAHPDRFLSGTESVNCVEIRLADSVLVKSRGGIKILHLSGESAFIIGKLEAGDLTDTVLPGVESLFELVK